jgi:hypothetical protein
MEVRYDREVGLARVTVHEVWPAEVDETNLIRTIRQLDPGVGLLVDLRAVDVSTAAHHEDLLARARRALSEIPRRRAYIVCDAEQDGIARMIQTLTPEGPEIEVFNDEQHAIRWLTTKRQQ